MSVESLESADAGSPAAPQGPATPQRPAGRGRLRATLDLLSRAPKFALVVVLLSLAAAAFAPLVAPHDPIAPDLLARELPPAWMDGGTVDHLLGTDRQGRDIFSRVLFGAQISMATAFVTLVVSAIIGVSLGLLAGYAGGVVDSVLMGAADLTLSFPTILLALILAATVGPSFGVVVMIITVMAWGRYARLVRSEVWALKHRDFVALAKIAGASPLRIILRHILPNLFNGIVVLSTLQIGWAIVTEGFLSFLGAGMPPPSPSWGAMISEGRNSLDTSWWISIFPGIAILVVVLATNIVGDWMRDELDPQLKGV